MVSVEEGSSVSQEVVDDTVATTNNTKKSDVKKDLLLNRLRSYELQAYAAVVTALRAKGDYTEPSRTCLGQLKEIFKIGTDRHKAEIRRATNDPMLAEICAVSQGFGVGELDDIPAWVEEGRCSIPNRIVRANVDYNDDDETGGNSSQDEQQNRPFNYMRLADILAAHEAEKQVKLAAHRYTNRHSLSGRASSRGGGSKNVRFGRIASLKYCPDSATGVTSDGDEENNSSVNGLNALSTVSTTKHILNRVQQRERNGPSGFLSKRMAASGALPGSGTSGASTNSSAGSTRGRKRKTPASHSPHSSGATVSSVQQSQSTNVTSPSSNVNGVSSSTNPHSTIFSSEVTSGFSTLSSNGASWTDPLVSPGASLLTTPSPIGSTLQSTSTAGAGVSSGFTRTGLPRRRRGANKSLQDARQHASSTTSAIIETIRNVSSDIAASDPNAMGGGAPSNNDNDASLSKRPNTLSSMALPSNQSRKTTSAAGGGIMERTTLAPTSFDSNTATMAPSHFILTSKVNPPSQQPLQSGAIVESPVNLYQPQMSGSKLLAASGTPSPRETSGSLLQKAMVSTPNTPLINPSILPNTFGLQQPLPNITTTMSAAVTGFVTQQGAPNRFPSAPTSKVFIQQYPTATAFSPQMSNANSGLIPSVTQSNLSRSTNPQVRPASLAPAGRATPTLMRTAATVAPSVCVTGRVTPVSMSRTILTPVRPMQSGVVTSVQVTPVHGGNVTIANQGFRRATSNSGSIIAPASQQGVLKKVDSDLGSSPLQLVSDMAACNPASFVLPNSSYPEDQSSLIATGQIFDSIDVPLSSTTTTSK